MQKSVSFHFQPKIRGPKPTENRSTGMPALRAKRKCPSSWTTMSTLKATTKERTDNVSMKSPLSPDYGPIDPVPRRNEWNPACTGDVCAESLLPQNKFVKKRSSPLKKTPPPLHWPH